MTEGLHINDEAPNFADSCGRLALRVCNNCGRSDQVCWGYQVCYVCGWNEAAELDLNEDEYRVFCAMRRWKRSSQKAYDLFISIRDDET